jgi:hypothetical protein
MPCVRVFFSESGRREDKRPWSLVQRPTIQDVRNIMASLMTSLWDEQKTDERREAKERGQPTMHKAKRARIWFGSVEDESGEKLSRFTPTKAEIEYVNTPKPHPNAASTESVMALAVPLRSSWKTPVKGKGESHEREPDGDSDEGSEVEGDGQVGGPLCESVEAAAT